MAKLPEEYIDIKSVHHRVEHLTLAPDSEVQKERILDDLILALTRSSKIPE